MTDKEALKIYKDRKRKQRKENIIDFFENLPSIIIGTLVMLFIPFVWIGPLAIGEIINNRLLYIIGICWFLFVLVSIFIAMIVDKIKDKIREKHWEIETIKTEYERKSHNENRNKI